VIYLQKSVPSGTGCFPGQKTRQLSNIYLKSLNF